MCRQQSWPKGGMWVKQVLTASRTFCHMLVRRRLCERRCLILPLLFQHRKHPQRSCRRWLSQSQRRTGAFPVSVNACWRESVMKYLVTDDLRGTVLTCWLEGSRDASDIGRNLKGRLWVKQSRLHQAIVPEQPMLAGSSPSSLKAKNIRVLPGAITTDDDALLHVDECWFSRCCSLEAIYPGGQLGCRFDVILSDFHVGCLPAYLNSKKERLLPSFKCVCSTGGVICLSWYT